MNFGKVLLTDLYQLTMLQGYFDRAMHEEAVFEFFVRRLPDGRNFLLAAGLEQALAYLETLGFSTEDIAVLADTGLFSDDFLRWLEDLRFTGRVDAMPEGTIFFADEPMLRITAPLPQAQLVESRLVNILHFQTLIASKAARCVLAARGKRLVDFGMRRAHGAEAALLAARATYLAGYAATATVLARPLFGIPIVGTMAHSFIQAHDSELEAFEHFASSHRGPVVLLIDTYDTEAGARHVAELAARLENQRIDSVRIDSGDLLALSRSVRTILDGAGCGNVGIFVSGGIDEFQIERLLAQNAPIDGFGVGTSVDVSEDCPALDCAYKLEVYRGSARRKRSPGKATWPGAKQVYRRYDPDGRIEHDVLTLDGQRERGEPLLEVRMREGKRVGEPATLEAARARAREGLAQLPEPLRALDRSVAHEVEVSAPLRRLAAEVDARYG